MTNEDLILQRLDALDAKIDPIIKDRQKWAELRQDLIPLQHQAVQILTEQLQEVEAGFQLEDLMAVLQQSMRSIKNFLFVIKTMDNIIELIQDVEPLMKSTVPKLIEYMDELEQKGVFRMIKVMMDVRAKVAATYDPEDIEQISDGMVSMLRVAKKMSDPDTLDFLEKAAAIPADLDLANTKRVGPFGMLSAGFNPEVKEGLGVMMALTKAMGKLKTDGHSQDDQADTSPST